MTNLEMRSRAVVRFYNKRGTTEEWIKEGKQAVKMTSLSCHRFRSNQVRLANRSRQPQVKQTRLHVSVCSHRDNTTEIDSGPDLMASTDNRKALLISDWTQAGKVLARLADQIWLRAIGQGRLTNDALIAISAGRLGAQLLTANERDFRRLAELRAFQWRVANV